MPTPTRYVSVWDTAIAPYSDDLLGLPAEHSWVDTADDRIAGTRADACGL